MNTGNVNIVVAHSLEANPLISLLNLNKAVEHTLFPVYENGKGLNLIVSGMGRAAAAKATAYLGNRDVRGAGLTSAWLNIGIAGHRSASIGDALLANKITEQATAESFYPGTLIEGFDSTPLITVDEIEKDYSEDVAYEMEASGFYRAAQTISSSELIQVLKIISDNRDNHVDHIDLKRIPKIIQAQQDRILQLIADLSRLLESHNKHHRLPDVFHRLESTLSFSATQEIQLKRICKRFEAQGKYELLVELARKKYHSSKQLISILEESLY